MRTDPLSASATEAVDSKEKERLSVFDVTADVFDSCRLLNPSAASLTDLGSESAGSFAREPETLYEVEEKTSKDGVILSRWTCNTCKTEFESLQDQRSHFKSDIHRLNIKLSVAGKAIVKEEDVDELTSESFQDYDVSSISGSEDEADTGPLSHGDLQKGRAEGVNKKKLFVCLRTGEKVSIWKSLIMEETESVISENDKGGFDDDSGSLPDSEVIGRLRSLIHESRDNKHLRIVLLASGGHFAGSVFDGKSVVAHKTFHRYVVRAKAGKKQSSKDGSGKSIHSAGASLRRYNELALKKEIQELLASWKPYFDAASCVFVHAPSNSRQLLFNAGKPCFSSQNCAVRDIPFTVRRPTLKESRHIYNQLTQLAYEAEEMVTPQEGIISNRNSHAQEQDSGEISRHKEPNEAYSSNKKLEEPDVSDEGDENEVVCTSTPLHEVAKSGDCERVLELLEEGLDPCAKDERGRTPYMLAKEKDVRNSFRRFMASNLDKWDWHAAKVPSPLTKEMEESQAAKQAEKDAKRKTRAKELKKLRKAREKKAQAEAAQSQNTSKDKQPQLSKEEELKRAMAGEREKRAAAAERRMAALNIQGGSTTTVTAATTTTLSSSSQPKTGAAGDTFCSCCNVSLVGKVPFHRYNYKYCSTSCMHVHREILEDG